jgi:PAS domain S-box-containing protein
MSQDSSSWHVVLPGWEMRHDLGLQAMSDLSPDTKALHVLILDQDLSVCTTVKQMLDAQGFEATSVNQPEQALDELRFGRHTVLIMEQCAQSSQTLDLLEKIRHSSPYVQMIFHTQGCSIEVAQQALKLDVFAIVEKSGNTDELLRTVYRAIHQYDTLAIQRCEMRFATIVNDLSDMVIRYLPDGTITFANRIFLDFFGLTAMEAIGKQVYDYIQPAKPIPLKTLLKQFSPHNAVITSDIKIQLSPVREIWFRWTMRAIYDQQNRIEEIQSTLHDITDAIYGERYLLSRVELSNNQLDETHKLLAQEIASHQKAQKRLQQHEAELAHVARLSIMGEMASSIAHELNQPLAAIANYTRGCIKRLERTENVDPNIVQAMEAAAQQSDRAGQILRRLRNMVQKRPTQKQPLPLQQIFDEVQQLILPVIHNHGMKLNVINELGDQLVNVDSIQIQQVFINLTRNAIEAMTPITQQRNLITVKMHRLDKATIKVDVMDQGHGLEGQNPAQLFDMFVSTNPEGLGIGLAICRTIIESHGGSCQADDLPDGGTIFGFTLPIFKPEQLQVAGLRQTFDEN